MSETTLKLKWTQEGRYSFAPFLSVSPDGEWEFSVNDMPVAWGYHADIDQAMLAAETALFSTYDDMTAQITAAKATD